MKKLGKILACAVVGLAAVTGCARYSTDNGNLTGDALSNRANRAYNYDNGYGYGDDRTGSYKYTDRLTNYTGSLYSPAPYAYVTSSPDAYATSSPASYSNRLGNNLSGLNNGTSNTYNYGYSNTPNSSNYGYNNPNGYYNNAPYDTINSTDYSISRTESVTETGTPDATTGRYSTSLNRSTPRMGWFGSRLSNSLGNLGNRMFGTKNGTESNTADAMASDATYNYGDQSAVTTSTAGTEPYSDTGTTIGTRVYGATGYNAIIENPANVKPDITGDTTPDMPYRGGSVSKQFSDTTVTDEGTVNRPATGIIWDRLSNSVQNNGDSTRDFGPVMDNVTSDTTSTNMNTVNNGDFSATPNATASGGVNDLANNESASGSDIM